MVTYVQPAVHMYNMSNQNIGAVSKGAMRDVEDCQNQLMLPESGSTWLRIHHFV